MKPLRNRFATILALALVPAALTACDDDDVTQPGPLTTADLAGGFEAESAVFTDVNDPTSRFGVVAEGGELTMDVQETGAFTTTIRRPGLADEVRTGILTVDGDDLRIQEDGFGTRSADFTFDRTTGAFTIDDRGDRFAFDGVEERQARSQIELKRTRNQ